MPPVTHQALSDLREIGSPDELRRLAGEGYAPTRPPRVNAHIHLPPNFSAFDAVSQAVTLAAEQGVSMLGASNYYDYSVYEDFAGHARRCGIFPLYGLEVIALIKSLAAEGVRINDPSNPGRMYLAGKGVTRFSEMSPRAADLLAVIRRNDTHRMEKMVRKLAGVFSAHGINTGLTASAIIDAVAKRHGCNPEIVTLQERHVAQAFQEALSEKAPAETRSQQIQEVLGVEGLVSGDPVTLQGAIRSHLMKAGKACFAEETFGGFAKARELILELGGIPCYPVLADGADPKCEYEWPVEGLVDRLHENDIAMAELIPIRNRPDVLAEVVRSLRAAGIAVVAGTEHNTLDLLPIEPACLDGVAVPDETKEFFVEGAYVIAAHQFLTLHGECGFVDAKGNPHPGYGNAQERITAFAAIGAAVVRKCGEFREKSEMK